MLDHYDENRAKSGLNTDNHCQAAISGIGQVFISASDCPIAIFICNLQFAHHIRLWNF